MPVRGGRLTPQERRFASAYAQTGSVRFASQEAHYTHESAGHKALARPGVRRQVDAVRERFAAEGATIAFRTLMTIAADDTAGKMPRVSAADKLLKAAGVYATKPEDDTPKDLHEMSASEIAKVILGSVLDQTVTDLEPAEDAPPAAAGLDDPLFD